MSTECSLPHPRSVQASSHHARRHSFTKHDFFEGSLTGLMRTGFVYYTHRPLLLCLLRWMKALVTFISPSQGDHYKLQLQNNKEQNTIIKHLFSWTVSLLVTTSPVLQCTYHSAIWILHKHLVSVVAHFFCTDFPFYKVCFHQQVGGPEMPYQGGE